MRISWMGHACFLLETQNKTLLLTDPYETGSYGGAIGYSALNIQPHIVTVSHQHFDHNYTQGMTKATIIDKPGRYKILDVEIEGVSSFHDDEGGRVRGKNIIFVIGAEGLRIAHFGDLGSLNIEEERFINLDVALIPVGGTFTLNDKQASLLVERLKPKITIPMHFKTPKLGFEIAGVELFLKGKDFERKEILEVNPSNIATFKKFVVLDYLQ